VEPLFLSLEEVLEIHCQQIERYGGASGVRDLALLVPHPISWTVFLIIIMQQPQGQAAFDGPAAGIET
jgi:hypothetical protein